jgi:COP9 signalosome complex subunit 4
MVTRVVLVHFSKAVQAVRDEPYAVICTAALQAIKSSASSALDEAEWNLRNGLFDYYASVGMFKDASIVLSEVNVDSTVRICTDIEKADVFIRSAESCLEGDEPVDAEIYVNKASQRMKATDDHSDKTAVAAINLRYRVAFARVQDSNRKFLEAARCYYDVSAIQNHMVDKGDLLQLLGKAVTCAVLAKSGPQRTRILALLYKDDRLEQLSTLANFSSHPALLEKMYKEQLLQPQELRAFESSLALHQKAMGQDGLTVMEMAVIEHNLQATSRLYDNIHITELAKFVGMEPEPCERLVAKMISEERLKAILDQSEGLLYFNEHPDEAAEWNDGIKSIFTDLTTCMEIAKERYPELMG